VSVQGVDELRVLADSVVCEAEKLVRAAELVRDAAASRASPIESSLRSFVSLVHRADPDYVRLAVLGHYCHRDSGLSMASRSVNKAAQDVGYASDVFGDHGRHLIHMTRGRSPLCYATQATGADVGLRYLYRPTAFGFAFVEALATMAARKSGGDDA